MPHHHDGHAGHTHGLTRSAETEGVSDGRLLIAVVLNQLLTVGQAAAGIVSGSVALLSDAAHNFNDANALLIAYVARRISRKKANERYTFGYRRAEMIGALINLTLLAVVGLYLVYEGVKRIFVPEEIVGWLMAATAVLALVIDTATAVLLWAMSKGSLNVRAAFVHNIVDALGSVAVLIGAGAIIWFEWVWVDSALTLLIAGYVLWQVYQLMPQVIRVLMQATPDGLDLGVLTSDIEKVEGVEEVHHVHAWQLDEEHRSLEAHIVVSRDQANQLEAIKLRVKQLLANSYDVRHSTLELEFRDGVSEHPSDCDAAPQP